MKKNLIALFLIFSGHLLWAQNSSWDSSYRPGAFQQKIAQFKSYANASSDIVFLGNSITAGTDWNELLQLPQARNRGISGDITFGVLERLDEVIEGHPAKVFILIGINDISRNIPDSIISQNHRKIVQRIKKGSPHTKIYLQTLLPVNNTFTKFPNHYNKDQHIKAVNDELKNIATQEHVLLVDLHPAFMDKEGKLNATLTEDGLHLNPKGYKVWADVLQKGKYLK